MLEQFIDSMTWLTTLRSAQFDPESLFQGYAYKVNYNQILLDLPNKSRIQIVRYFDGNHMFCKFMIALLIWPLYRQETLANRIFHIFFLVCFVSVMKTVTVCYDKP